VARGTSFEEYLFTFINGRRTNSNGSCVVVDGTRNLEGSSDAEESEDQKNWSCCTMSA